MDKIDAVLGRFPQYTYNPEDKQTALYKLIKAIVDEFNITIDNINRLNSAIGIDTALPDDIYSRFGSLLGIEQNKNETDEQYRHRLKVSVTSLSGGTAEAIKYAVGSGLGVNNDQEAMDRIKVYDAWDYDGDADNVIRDYGYIVCSVDLNNGAYSTDTEKIVLESANSVKATGTAIQFIYHNFRILYYAQLDDVTYASLGTLKYNQVGE